MKTVANHRSLNYSHIIQDKLKYKNKFSRPYCGEQVTVQIMKEASQRIDAFSGINLGGSL